MNETASATDVSASARRVAFEPDAPYPAVAPVTLVSAAEAFGGRRPPDRRVPTGRRRRSGVRYVAEWVIIVIAAIGVAFTVRSALVQAFYIPSESMVPTLKVHDRLLVDKVSFRMRQVHRGEIVVFRRPPRETDTSIKELIKRVVALPGETVEAIDGHVYINGRKLDERYLPAGVLTLNLPPQRIPIDSFWVMGDNRTNSSDSRVFGPIDRKLIVGRAFLRVYPLRRFGRL